MRDHQNYAKVVANPISEGHAVELARDHRCHAREAGQEQNCLMIQAVLAQNNLLVSQCLWQHGCRDARDRDGKSALHLAVAKGMYEMAERLVFGQYAASCIDHLGETPLMTAAALGYTEIARLLIMYGADVNARSFSGKTALHYAAFFGWTKTALVIIETPSTEVKINLQTDSGDSPLHYAAIGGSAGMAYILLQKGALYHINDQNGCGQTALYCAVLHHHLECVKVLLDYEQCDPVIPDYAKPPRTPLDLARTSNFPDSELFKRAILDASPSAMPTFSATQAAQSV